jgi:hypothetical protein
VAGARVVVLLQRGRAAGLKLLEPAELDLRVATLDASLAQPRFGFANLRLQQSASRTCDSSSSRSISSSG